MMNDITDSLNFSVPLSIEAHAIAQECRQGISNSQKSRQVYLNTLAVYAVDYYLQCMGFTMNWEDGDRQNKVAVQLMDVADLKIQNIGKIECRPVLPESEFLEIPAEVWEDRIGYIAVQFDASLKEAKILGFTKKPAMEIPLIKLQSLSDFLIYLSEMETVESPQIEKPSNLVKIGHWLDGLVDAGWQKIDELLHPQQLGLAFKSAVCMTRGQKIDLGMQLEKISVALIVKINAINNGEFDILTQLYPMGEMVLPEGVKLVVNDDLGETILAAISRKDDNWIQLEFSAELGENFQIAVAYGESEQKTNFEV
ncbi:MAG: DUF1822 family protein [Cyanobacteria bacterium P01_A01_bin.68]